MRFPLTGRPWVIGLLVCGLCLADSGVHSASSPEPGEVSRTSTLLVRAEDFFHSQPRTRNVPVTVGQTPANIWQDQKEIWSSPFHLKKADLRWILPLAATTGVLLATDHHTMTRIHSDPSNRSLSSNISNAGVGTLGAAAALYFAVGKLTRDEHARETGILTAEALTDSILVSEALKFCNAARKAEWEFGGRPFLARHFPELLVSVRTLCSGLERRGRDRA